MIARFLRRKLIVHWKPTRECNVEFHELFKSIPKDISVLPFDIPVSSSSVEFIQEAADRYNMTMKVLDIKKNQLWGERNVSFFLTKDFFLWDDYSILFTDYDGRFTFEEVPCQFYYDQHSKLLRQFEPIDEIAAVVNQVSDFFVTALPIGVHIRTFDRRYDWEIVPPLQGTHATAFGQSATVEDFIRVMKHLETHLTYPAADASKPLPLVRFFVTSNDYLAKKEIIKHFPTALSLSSEISRETTEGLRHALTEWLILTKCSLLLNTFGSSFAVEAAFYSHSPLLGLWEAGSLVLQENPHVKYCGSLHFAKYLSSKATRGSFVQGGEQVVDGHQVALAHCGERMSNWGLSDLSILCISEEF
jgi:hypothetical protein